MTTTATPGRDAFRGECLSLAAQLELYAKIDGILPGVVAAMHPVSGRDAATLEACAQIAKFGAKECTDGDTDWHKGFRYAAHSTALEIESSIRALSNHKESGT